jgi:hypothetical protein
MWRVLEVGLSAELGTESEASSALLLVR